MPSGVDPQEERDRRYIEKVPYYPDPKNIAFLPLCGRSGCVNPGHAFGVYVGPSEEIRKASKGAYEKRRESFPYQQKNDEIFQLESLVKRKKEEVKLEDVVEGLPDFIKAMIGDE